MKLKKYAKPVRGGGRANPKEARLSVSASTISFNMLACELCGIKEGGGIILHDDEDAVEPNNWVFQVEPEVSAGAYTVGKNSGIAKSLSISCKTFSSDHKRGHYSIEKDTYDGIIIFKVKLEKETQGYTRKIKKGGAE